MFYIKKMVFENVIFLKVVLFLLRKIDNYEYFVELCMRFVLIKVILFRLVLLLYLNIKLVLRIGFGG